jgi:outer membrane cobalamin receptor
MQVWRKKMKFRTILLVLFFTVGLVYSQNRQSSGSGGQAVTGSVYDVNQGEPIEYANIILFDRTDSTQITGTTSGEAGRFTIKGVRPGNYYLQVRFIGYHNKTVDAVQVEPTSVPVDLGVIPMEPTVLNMESVAVEVDRAAVTYEIDKKVVDVSKMQTAVSGSAVEVLENVPSVTVDIEGNVSLRGSGNFRLLIDGRPTIMDATDALQQIPASTIENIEIITNPSSKFDPDGTSGIINLVMKKNKTNGRSALVNANGGLNDKYGGDVLFQSRQNNVSYLVGLDYTNHVYEGNGMEERRTTHDGVDTYMSVSGNGNRGRYSQGLRAAVEWDVTSKDLFTINSRFSDGSFKSSSDRDYLEWDDQDPGRNRYFSREDGERSGTSFGLNLGWLHRFAQKGHELNAEVNYGYRDGDDDSNNELLNDAFELVQGKRSTESGPSRDLELKLDYTLPLGKEEKFEAGFESEFDRSKEETAAWDYDAGILEYVELPDYAHTTTYNRTTLSLYALYAGNAGSLGYQGGLRAEYTDRLVELADQSERAVINRWDLFPTLHFSYQLGGQKQAMASYTRRIDRPRGYWLEPFETWDDAYNVRTGNPGLKPEYIDSYEVGYSMPVGQTMVSSEVYYRVSDNKIERVRSVYDDNITLRRPENVGTDYALGWEMMIDAEMARFWNLGLTGNLYDYRVKGVIEGQEYERQSFNWSTRLNNTFKITSSLQVQLTGRFISPSVSSQGRREGFFMTDMAIRKDFMDRMLSLTLQVRDLFDQARYEYESKGTGFYTRREFNRESPIVMLNARLNLNNFKQDRRDGRGGGMDGGMGGDIEF